MTQKTPARFEDQLAKLETIVQQMDAEDLPLEKLLSLYEEGVKLGANLNQMLNKAQQRIEILMNAQDGELKTEPFEEPQA